MNYFQHQTLGREKARFYRIARRSATECAAVLDVRSRLTVALGEESGREEDLRLGREFLIRIVQMLVKMARRAEAEPETETGSGSET